MQRARLGAYLRFKKKQRKAKWGITANERIREATKEAGWKHRLYVIPILCAQGSYANSGRSRAPRQVAEGFSGALSLVALREPFIIITAHKNHVRDCRRIFKPSQHYHSDRNWGTNTVKKLSGGSYQYSSRTHPEYWIFLLKWDI